MKRTPSVLETPGAFVVGCNYWASHAGSAMWSDWRPRVVEQDLSRLSKAGIEVLRVFPLWPDFQPIVALRGGHGAVREIRFAGEEPLPDDRVGQAGVSAEMLDRFAQFCRMARRYDLRLVVGLITGWMSGRLFAPAAFAHVNVLTDPLALVWQTRLVRILVERFSGERAILAWDLGNECNCMASVPSREAASAWTALICGTIRAVDQSRPIVSGMHSLMPEPAYSGGWTIQDQAEHTDVLTTHPYPLWSRHTSQDPIDALRTTFHATAETRMYADVGRTNCFAEETGTMGPMMGDWDAAARFVRTNLFSLWANDCRGFLWWCAFDQTDLAHAPYDWVGVERELGLLRANGSAKPMLAELSRFRGFLSSLPFRRLPTRRTEAVCLLSRGQDQWAVAYAAFVLSKQAGFDLEFQFVDQPLKSARLYLLPSICGTEPISRRRWLDLLERVRAGADLYVSLNDGVLSPFTDIFGVRVCSRATHTGATDLVLASGAGSTTLTVRQGLDLRLQTRGATVLGASSDGNHLFTSAPLDRGRVWLLAFPVEQQLTATPGAFDRDDSQPFWQIYETFAARALSSRAVHKHSSALAVTEHDMGRARRLVVFVNHGRARLHEPLDLDRRWRVSRVLRGNLQEQERVLAVDVPGHDAVVVELARK